MGVALGLEQQRVHAHIGHGAGGQGLEVLGASDFARTNHAGVIAHVLRLEGRYLEALARVVAAQGCGQPAFAGATGGPQNHDALGCHAMLSFMLK